MAKKRDSKPIPEYCYERFKYKLEETSGKWIERNMTLFLLDVATGYRMQDVSDLTIAEIIEALYNGYFEIQEKKESNNFFVIQETPQSYVSLIFRAIMFHITFHRFD